MTSTDVVSIGVDQHNPGQFFACCGLMELAHRISPGAEAWFERTTFHLTASDDIFAKLRESTISSPSDQERIRLEGKKKPKLSEEKLARLKQLKRRSRTLTEQEKKESDDLQARRNPQKLTREEESRLKQLETLSRSGAVHFMGPQNADGQPFSLMLNWWDTADDDEGTVKTWAGRQEIKRIALAAQEALPSDGSNRDLFEYSAVLTDTTAKKVEPFYFDPRRFAHPLDVGFSLDKQDIQTVAYPAVELLALIGLQRFRPRPSGKWHFEYQTWPKPLTVVPAAGVASASCPAPGAQRYRFGLLFRDDQKRLKAFAFAKSIGGQ